MFLSHVVATTQDGIIGINNDLPWGFIKADMKFFKDLTTNHVVIMGMNTVLSLPDVLARRFVVCDVKPDRERKINLANLDFPNLIKDKRYPELLDNLPPEFDRNQIFIAGGGEVYRNTIDDVTLVWRNVIHPLNKIEVKPEDKLATYPVDILERDFYRLKADFIVDPKAAILTELWVRKQ